MRSTSVSVIVAMMLASSAAGACSAMHSPSDPAGPSPTVSNVAPSSAAVGDRVTITGTGFMGTGNAIKVSGGYLRDLPSANGTTMVFTLPEGMDQCPPFTNGPCIQTLMLLTPGEYTLNVMTSDGTSNAVTLTVRQP